MHIVIVFNVTVVDMVGLHCLQGAGKTTLAKCLSDVWNCKLISGWYLSIIEVALQLKCTYMSYCILS